MPDPNQQPAPPAPVAAVLKEVAKEVLPDPNLLEFGKSSNLKSAKLDPATEIVDVTFGNGATAKYEKFTPELMKEWASAQSAGTWFHQNVRQKPDLHPMVGAPAGAPAAPPPPKKEPKPVAKVTAPPPPAPVVPSKPLSKMQKLGAFWRKKNSRGFGNGATTP